MHPLLFLVLRTVALGAAAAALVAIGGGGSDFAPENREF
jgi:hypothetical protein